MKVVRTLGFLLLSVTSAFGALKQLPKDIATASNNFGMELFYMLNQPGKNVVLSPFSINAVLYMSYLGAAGDTMKNMRSNLGISTSQSSLARSFGEYLASLQSGDNLSHGYILNLCNGMWVQQHYSILQTYRTLIKDSFGGFVQEVDFTKAPQAIYTINNAIIKATNGRISDFLTEDDIGSSMRLLLTNTYFFKGEWKYPFPNARTRQALFNPYGGNAPVMTRTMFGEFMLPYYEDKFLQAISLPIKSRSTQPDMELIIILPKGNENEAPFNYLYNGKDLTQITQAMRSERVKLSLPKYTFTVRIPLVGSLETLGMTAPFAPTADFSRITGKKNLLISEFLTESYFSVNEGGIVAAAGSSAGFQIKSSIIHKKAKIFEANHPFLYILRDSYSNVIHFIGEYDAPSAETFAAPKVTLEPQAPQHRQQAPTDVNPLQEEDTGNPSGVEGNPSQG